MKVRVAAAVVLAAVLTVPILSVMRSPASAAGERSLSAGERSLSAGGASALDRLFEDALRKKAQITLMIGHTTFSGTVTSASRDLVALRYQLGENRELTAYIPAARIDAVILEETVQK